MRAEHAGAEHAGLNIPDLNISDLNISDLDFIRREIEQMRIQVGRQRKEIIQLQRAGLGTALAEALLGRMLVRIDARWDQRDEMKKSATHQNQGRVLGGRTW